MGTYGRQGLGVAQVIVGSDYPLASAPPSTDIRYLLADLWLAYDDPADYAAPGQVTPFKPPFRVYYMYGFGGDASSPPAGVAPVVNDREMVIMDATGRIVIDTALLEPGHSTHYYRKPWSTRLEITGWEKEFAVLFVVAHTQWPDPPYTFVTETTYAEHINPTTAIIDERAWQRRPKRVRSFTVVLDNVKREPVEFVEGYNVDIVLSDEIVAGNRVKRQLTFAAVSGNGAGVYPGCQPQPLLLTRINGRPPTKAGDYYLTGTDCYWVRRQPIMHDTVNNRVGAITPALLQVGNDCGPCCECAQFVSTARYMNRTRDRYDAIGTEAEQTRDKYHLNRNRWNAGKCCFDTHLLRLQVRAQLCPHIDVLGQFCNWTAECVGPLVMTFDFTETGTYTIDTVVKIPTAIVTPGFTNARSNMRMENRRSPQTTREFLTGVWPLFTYTFDEVEPYQNVWVKFRLLMENCGVDDGGDPFMIRCCLRASLAGEPLFVACGDNALQPTSSLSSSSMVSIGIGYGGFEICKEDAVQCPPATDDLYNPTKCFTRAQIFEAIG